MGAPAEHSTDKLLDVLKLCFKGELPPVLTPKNVCMLICACSELRDKPLSWHDHSIDVLLDGSPSAIT
jgi:hypothetical protein